MKVDVIDYGKILSSNYIKLPESLENVVSQGVRPEITYWYVYAPLKIMVAANSRTIEHNDLEYYTETTVQDEPRRILPPNPVRKNISNSEHYKIGNLMYFLSHDDWLETDPKATYIFTWKDMIENLPHFQEGLKETSSRGDSSIGDFQDDRLMEEYRLNIGPGPNNPEQLVEALYTHGEVTTSLDLPRPKTERVKVERKEPEKEQLGPVEGQYDPDTIEEQVIQYWDKVNAYEKTKAHRADGENFFFVDGPPYTSGTAHMGTTWNKTLKDAYIRYLRMCGYNVYDRPGFDMHGLPIETKVEEQLGFENKKDIKEFGIKEFIKECNEFAENQLDGLQEDFISFGVWMDWENPYKTVTPEYMEAAWWGFKQAHERGLVEKGKRSISQCPRCETAIAKNEVEYYEAERPSIYVKFSLKNREGYLVTWTTTPWTILANTFVAIDENFTYQGVRAKKDGNSEVLYIREPLVEAVLEKSYYEDYEIEDEVLGGEMIGWEYEHPLAEEISEYPDPNGALEVYHADYVEGDRTGLVPSSSGHGEEDFERATELGIGIFCPVSTDGVYTEEAGKYKGQFIHDANDDIIADLKAKDLILADETHTHDHGRCWRCDTDIIQIVTDQWFITITDIKDELLNNIKDSEWYPSWVRENRFRDFVERAPDWNISRQRYWDIPIPIWMPVGASSNEEAEEIIVVGTREELAERADQDIDPDAVDLHKPTVDDLTITENGTTYTRIPDVFDIWFDSSVATWGTLDYPKKKKEFKDLWPADLIIEAHDQTRGWFWSQLGMGTAALDENPYKRVLMHGHVLDEDGRKMSKSLGNIISPQEAIEKHGRDVMRLFLLSVEPQGNDMRFSWDEMAAMGRRLNILWNVFRFPLPYMRRDGFDPTENDIKNITLESEDEWLLSQLQAVKHDITEAWEEFHQDKALDILLDFIVEDVSRYYIQLIRKRIWEEKDSESKIAAYATLYHVLLEIVALLAPFAPFVTEEIYQHLTENDGYDSVHMLDWPDPNKELRQPALEETISTIRSVEEAGAKARQQADRKLRWPVDRVVINAESEDVHRAVQEHSDLLANQLNTRKLELVDPHESWEELRYSAEVDKSVLGPVFGERTKEVMEALNEATVEEPDLDALTTTVEDSLDEAGQLTEDMVKLVEDPPADVTRGEFDGGTVYIDTTLTRDIKAEGYAREVIRRVQEMRKELDLNMDEQIRLDIRVDNDKISELVHEYEDLIKQEVRAAEIDKVEDGYEEEWEVEGVPMKFILEPLATTL